MCASLHQWARACNWSRALLVISWGLAGLAFFVNLLGNNTNNNGSTYKIDCPVQGARISCCPCVLYRISIEFPWCFFHLNSVAGSTGFMHWLPPPPPPPPLRRSTIHICLFQILRDTPFKDGNGLGFWPPITGFWKGSHQNYPPITGFWKGSQQNYPPYQRFLEGKLAKLPPKWRKIWKLPLIKNISEKNAKRPPISTIFRDFFPQTEPLKYTPFPKNRERACGTDDHLSGGAGALLTAILHIKYIWTNSFSKFLILIGPTCSHMTSFILWHLCNVWI